MTDTAADITALVHTRLMAKSGAERFLMGVRMHEAARRMVMASFPASLPAQDVRNQLRQRMYADAEFGFRRESVLDEAFLLQMARASSDFSAAY